jgi:protein-tyrosine phosphatase
VPGPEGRPVAGPGAPEGEGRPVAPGAPPGEERAALVDLHSHVLPGVDDGARDEGEALRMLRIAEADGIAAIVATPHTHHCPADRIAPAVARLNLLAADAGLAIRVLPGSEVRLAADLPARYRAGALLTLNHGPYLLLEVPLSGGWPASLLRVVDELQALGLRPVLAHAERYQDVQRDPALLDGVIAAGVPIQINATSLVGPAERGAQPAAERLVRGRMAHLLASDAHNAEWRPPRLQAAVARAAELAGADYAAWMVAAASAVARGDALTLPAPARLPGGSG